MKGQILEREKSRKDKVAQEQRDDQMPGLKFGEFEDRYAAMKDRYMQSLKHQLEEKEARNKQKESEKLKDMDRLRKDIRRQVDEEKVEKKDRQRYKREFYENENKRIAQNQEFKKNKRQDEINKDLRLHDQQMSNLKEEEARRRKQVDDRESKYLEDLKKQIDDNIAIRKNKTERERRLPPAMTAMMSTKEVEDLLKCMECEKPYPSNRLSFNTAGICLSPEKHTHDFKSSRKGKK